jgi:pentapeptide repeat protein
MDQLTIRQTSAELPSFDPEMALEPLPRLDADSRLVADFQFGDATMDALVVDNTQLLRGKIRTLRAQTARIIATRMDCVEFTGCDLSSLRWQEGKISRVLFDGCKFSAARFKAVAMEHIDRAQTMQLGEALAAELKVTFGDEDPGHP